MFKKFKTSSVNINGIGRNSTHKVQNFRQHMFRTDTHVGFVQETKSKSLPTSFLTAFPKTLFRTYINFASQGAAIIINKTLLPDDKFEIELSQSSSSSHILQNLSISDENNNSLKFSHVYQSPSLSLAPTLFKKITDFSPTLVLGDINETSHKKKQSATGTT